MRVLVVEDEPDVGAVFRDFLIELGHEPVLVRSAEAALRKLETDRPDAILLDVHLPGLSGLDFLQLRPVRDAGLPIIAVSGVATESQARECLQLGAIDFVGKPVAFERLGEVLAYIEPHALHRQLTAGGREPERRRTPRLKMTFPVSLTTYDGTECAGWAVDLSPSGMRVRTEGAIAAGSAAKLSFSPPDGKGPMQIMSLLVRSDSEGYAFSFVNLTHEDFQRLTDYARRLA
jgi:DNA-binding response OmpR family regulator